jgi:hypothetical protein
MNEHDLLLAELDFHRWLANKFLPIKPSLEYPASVERFVYMSDLLNALRDAYIAGAEESKNPTLTAPSEVEQEHA